MDTQELYEKLETMTRRERVEYCQALLGQLGEYGRVRVRYVRVERDQHDYSRLGGLGFLNRALWTNFADPRGGSTEVAICGDDFVTHSARAYCRPTENFQRHYGIAFAATRLLDALNGKAA